MCDVVCCLLVPTISPNVTSAFNTSSTSINLTWSEVPLEHINGEMKGYVVRYKELNESYSNSKNINISNCSIVLQNLKIYTAYEISVAAASGAGAGKWSVPVIVVTDLDGKS